MGQQYRLRTPSTGREILVEAEPGHTYLDRETGEPLEVVGKLLPLAPSKSAAPVGGREPPLLQLVRPDGPEGPQRLPHVRPPHGRAPALTRPSATVRLLRSTLLFTVLALALAAAGCGSDGGDVPEVPGPPAELTVPHAEGRRRPVSSDASATPTPTPVGRRDRDAHRPPAGTTGSTGTTGGTGTNTAATPTPAAQQQDSASNDTAPAGGSPPQQFEQFCQENAGAC